MSKVKVKHVRGSTEFINSCPIKDGQKLYDTDTGKEYMDVGSERIERHKNLSKLSDTVVDSEHSYSNLHSNGVYSNALIRTVQGEVIAVDDVSPLEHEVKCTVSGVPDLSKVTVSRYGKNIASGKIVNLYADANGTCIENADMQSIILPFSGSPFNLYQGTDGGFMRYSFTYVYPIPGTPLIFKGYEPYEAGRNTNVRIPPSYLGESPKYVLLTFMRKSKTPASVEEVFQSLNIVAQGEAPKSSIPKTNPTVFSPNPEGIVSGMTSLSPDMTILTDTPGALLDVEYSRDLQDLDDQVQNTNQAVLDMNNVVSGKADKDLGLTGATKTQVVQITDVDETGKPTAFGAADLPQGGGGGYPQDNPAMTHNLPRGKFLGNSVTDKQYADIANGTFEDMYVGDYWTINDIDWLIAGVNYYQPYDLKRNHLVIIPRGNLGDSKQFSSSDDLPGGYGNSYIRLRGLETAEAIVNTAFSGHTIEWTKYVSTEGDTGRDGWFQPGAAYVELMTERMVFGCPVFQNNNKVPWVEDTVWNVAEQSEAQQLPIFTFCPSLIWAHDGYDYWLRDMADKKNGVAVMFGRVGLKPRSEYAGVRPCFCIG